MTEKNNFYKILLVGDSMVGKTSLIKLYKEEELTINTLPTVGCEYHIINKMVENKIIKLIIWDSAGQEKYRALTKSWFKGARGILLIFSLIDRRSFENVKRWFWDIKENLDNFSILIIGNKIDLKENRVVSYQEGFELAKSLKSDYFETSIFFDDLPIHCKSIDDIFWELILKILQEEKEKTVLENSDFKLDLEGDKNYDSCKC